MNDQSLLDEVAKELYVRRTFNIKGMKEYELQESAMDCYVKARAFITARSLFESGGKG